MNLIHALLLGLLQGATEFLPVSSSGHLAIAQYFIKGFEQPGVLFDVVLHCGTLCAVLIYFWKDVCSLLTAPWASGNDGVVRRRLLWLIIAGSVPTAIIGLTFKDALTSVFTIFRWSVPCCWSLEPFCLLRNAGAVEPVVRSN